MADSASRRTDDGEVHEHQQGHGNSTAAWTSVIVIMIGSLIMSAAVLMSSVSLFVVGAVVVVLGAVAGKVLAAMGYGAQAAARPDPDR